MQGLSYIAVCKNKKSLTINIMNTKIPQTLRYHRKGEVPGFFGIPGTSCIFYQIPFFTRRFPVFLVFPLSQLFHVPGTALPFYPPTKIDMGAVFIIFAAFIGGTWILRYQDNNNQVSFNGSTPVSRTQYPVSNTRADIGVLSL